MWNFQLSVHTALYQLLCFYSIRYASSKGWVLWYRGTVLVCGLPLAIVWQRCIHIIHVFNSHPLFEDGTCQTCVCWLAYALVSINNYQPCIIVSGAWVVPFSTCHYNVEQATSVCSIELLSLFLNYAIKVALCLTIVSSTHLLERGVFFGLMVSEHVWY